MPPLPRTPVPVLEIHLKHSVDMDTDVLPRFFMQYSGTPPTSAQLNALATAIGGSWVSTIGTAANPQVTLTEVDILDIGSTGAANGLATMSHAGTRTGAANPAGVATVLNFKVARRYRGGKPKIFLPYGINADLTASGQWVPGLITLLDNNWAQFISDIDGEAWSGGSFVSQVSVSYYSGFTTVTDPITHRARNVPTLRGTPVVDAVIGATLSPIVGSQRRRNRGSG